MMERLLEWLERNSGFVFSVGWDSQKRSHEFFLEDPDTTIKRHFLAPRLSDPASFDSYRIDLNRVLDSMIDEIDHA